MQNYLKTNNYCYLAYDQIMQFNELSVTEIKSIENELHLTIEDIKYAIFKIPSKILLLNIKTIRIYNCDLMYFNNINITDISIGYCINVPLLQILKNPNLIKLRLNGIKFPKRINFDIHLTELCINSDILESVLNKLHRFIKLKYLYINNIYNTNKITLDLQNRKLLILFNYGITEIYITILNGTNSKIIIRLYTHHLPKYINIPLYSNHFVDDSCYNMSKVDNGRLFIITDYL